MVADTYLRMGDIYREFKKYDSALLFESSALKEFEGLGNKSYLAICLNNIGNIYQAKRNHQKALDYFFQAFANVDSTEQSDEMGFYAANISVEFLNVGNFEQALFYAKKALQLFQKTGNKEWQKRILQNIAGIYTANKDYKNAIHYINEYDALKDSLNNTQSQNKISELQSHYENGQKEKQIDFLKKEAMLNTTIRNVLIIGSALLVIIVLLIARQYSVKRKSEYLIKAKNIALSKTLEELKSTQSQLIQSEKMASLGELTAGIAHEIQNPLNFVNNFSEVSNELISEIQEERHKEQGTRDEQMQDEILNDIKQNLEKINHHGKRADAIVKGMLQHSRSSAGVKEPTDINALADEYLRLSYHGLRAKDKDFNATMNTDFDNAIGKINIIPQDIGRVLLNLYNNAFYAVSEKKKSAGAAYEPIVTVSTKKSGNQVSIIVSDNGNGIPKNIVDKIFQPFFTTKPTGQGTGLGLSLSYDIVKAHGGEIKVQTKEGEGSEFVVQLPL
jgi:two-component system NtrC family sensor kinase